MKSSEFFLVCFCVLFQVEYSYAGTKSLKIDFTGTNESSFIRGFDYSPVNGDLPGHHIGWQINYDSSIIAFDFNLAKCLDLNQVSVFVPYADYKQDKKDLPARLCNKRIKWYTGGLNGKYEAQSLDINFDFLEKGNYNLNIIKDGSNDRSFSYESIKVKKGNIVKIGCLPQGGFVGFLGINYK